MTIDSALVLSGWIVAVLALVEAALGIFVLMGFREDIEKELDTIERASAKSTTVLALESRIQTLERERGEFLSLAERTADMVEAAAKHLKKPVGSEKRR